MIAEVYDALKSAGASEEQARAAATAVAEMAGDQRLATKDDLNALRIELKAEMNASRWQIIAAVALLLLAHLGAVWSMLPGGGGSG
jgi:hypothetical protein